MATYTFDEVPVYDVLPGGALRTVRAGQVRFRDYETDAVVATVSVGANGKASYGSDTRGVLVMETDGGFRRVVFATEALLAAATFGVSEDNAVAGILGNSSSASRAALAPVISAAVDGRVPKGDLMVNVKNAPYNAVGNGTTDDTAAINAAVAAAKSTGRTVFFPKGTYLVEAPILVQDATDFAINMEGRLKRKNGSAANSLLYFKNVAGLRGTAIRTHGNVLNNQATQSDSNTYPVDEAKHDVRLEGCSDVALDLIDSINPAGDTLYVVGGSTRIKLGHVNSVSGQSSGRNAVSLIDCSAVSIGTVYSKGTGCATGVISMPGGLDIEPNSGQAVTDVTVGEVIVETSGTGGVGLVGLYPVSGVKQIRRVKIGQATLIKTAGVKSTACNIPIRGVEDVTVSRLTHVTDAANTNQAMVVDDSTGVVLDVDIDRTGTLAVNIGATGTVTNLRMRGRIGASASHCLQIYRLDNADIDMTLKNPGTGFALVAKNSVGTSTNVRFRGDWRKDTTGSQVLNIGGTTTDWLLDGGDITGWGVDTRVKGSGNPTAVGRVNVRGLTYGTAAPNFDAWNVGHYVENTAPAELGTAGSKYIVQGWRCVAAGSPGTWVPVRALTGN